MNSKDKAKELIERFGGYKTETGFIIVNIERAKQCALICVDEILIFIDERKEGYKYWKSVKQEIKNYE